MMKSLSELKKLVIGPSNLNATFHYFFDLMDSTSIASRGELLTKHETKHAPEIKSLLSATADISSKFLNKKVKFINPKLISIREEKLIHGFCNVLSEDVKITLLYFTDVKTCVFYLSAGNHNEYFRFSLVPASLKTQAH